MTWDEGNVNGRKGQRTTEGSETRVHRRRGHGRGHYPGTAGRRPGSREEPGLLRPGPDPAEADGPAGGAGRAGDGRGNAGPGGAPGGQAPDNGPGAGGDQGSRLSRT